MNLDIPFAYAFTAGLVATVNPCGFAMLPAYLSYFLGIDTTAAADEATETSVARALLIGATVSVGFLVVFGLVGLVLNAGVQSFIDYVKWVTIAIGFALIALGIALLAGYHLPFSTPRLDRGGRTRRLGSVFVFGISYAVASIGCALPIFLTVVFGTATRTNFASGVGTFLAYGLGMSLVLTTLTITLALAKHSLLRVLRQAMRWADRVAGAFLIVAGTYLVYYWLFNIVSDYGTGTGSGPIAAVDDFSTFIANQIHDWGATRVGAVLAGVVAACIGFVWSARRRAGARA